MAKSINELQPINANGANLSENTLLEAVTGVADAEGIRARRMSAGQLEAFIAREAGAEETPAPVEALVAARVAAEATRATAREDAIEEAAANALSSEAARAIAAEAALGQNKANMVISSKGLNEAAAGDALGEVRFRTWVPPVLPTSAGFIELSDGSRLELDENGDFRYLPNAGAAVEIITNGAWQRDTLNLGILTVATESNANNGAWVLARWGSRDQDLSDIKQLAIEGKQRAANALDSVALANQALATETTRATAAEAGLQQAIDALELEAQEVEHDYTLEGQGTSAEQLRVSTTLIEAIGVGQAAHAELQTHKTDPAAHGVDTLAADIVALQTDVTAAQQTADDEVTRATTAEADLLTKIEGLSGSYDTGTATLTLEFPGLPPVEIVLQ
jgi:hypothetical protein